MVSTDDRNKHPRATTVLVIPFTTSVHKDVATHLYLSPGESGLEHSALRAEDITVVQKESLEAPRVRVRTLSNARICELADRVKIAMGCVGDN